MTLCLTTLRWYHQPPLSLPPTSLFISPSTTPPYPSSKSFCSSVPLFSLEGSSKIFLSDWTADWTRLDWWPDQTGDTLMTKLCPCMIVCMHVNKTRLLILLIDCWSTTLYPYSVCGNKLQSTPKLQSPDSSCRISNNLVPWPGWLTETYLVSKTPFSNWREILAL